MKNCEKHRNVKLVITKRRRNYLVSEPKNKGFYRKLLAIEMRKTQILINESVYLGLSILDLIKTVMYEFWFGYVTTKYDLNVKIYCMDTDSFIVHVKIDDIHKNIAEDIETRFDTSNLELGSPLAKGKTKKSSWINER